MCRKHALLVSLLATATLFGCASPQSQGKADSTSQEAADPASASDASADDAPKPTSEVRAAAGKDSEDKAAKKEKDKKEKAEKEAEAKQKKWDETTEDMERTEGLFTVWTGKDKVYIELDEKSLGRPFLYFGALDRGMGPSGVYRGAMLWDSAMVLSFEQRNEKKIVMQAQNTRYLEPGDSMEQKMLDEVTSPSMLATFDKIAENEEAESFLIDIGSFFNSDHMELSKAVGSKYGPSKDLCQFPEVQNFPRNIEISQELVVSSKSRSGGTMTMADPRSVVLKVHHSICALPTDGFKSRKMDQRTGYFLTARKDMLDVEAKDPVVRFAERWRLQKKDPTADVSDPVEPIVYWVENTTPKKWREAVSKGIEAWEPAFRKAGFSNAIVARQMPDDAEWHPADVRYSVVRWSADEGVGFAIGPSRTDPRTGEIFDADITMQAGFLTTYKRRFETYIQDMATMPKEQIRAQVDAMLAPQIPDNAEQAVRMCKLGGNEFLDHVSQAQALATMYDKDFDSDDFLSAMLIEVVAHEVGHTLGLRHNFKASTWHSLEDVHDVELTADVGLVGSVMDYNAVNIAGPGQKQGEYFPSAVGAYDMWVIEWGYKETNSDAALRAIAARSAEVGLDYATDEDSWFGDAYAATWDMSGDPVGFASAQIALAEEGFRELKNKGADDGDGFHEYGRWYGMFSSLYQRYMMMMSRYIGGYTLNKDLVGQEGGRAPIVPVDPVKQREALEAMINKGLKWNGGIPDEEQLLLANKKYGSWGSWIDMWSFDPIPRLVNNMRFYPLYTLSNYRMYERLGSQTRFDIPNALTPMEVANQVFQAVWTDEPSEHDRWTQSDYVMLVMNNLQVDTSPDVTSLFDAMLRRAENRCKEYATSDMPQIAAHGQWLSDRIERFRQRQMVEMY